jgi:hypothetical protein
LAQGSRQKRNAIFARIGLTPPRRLFIHRLFIHRLFIHNVRMRECKHARGPGAALVVPTVSIEAMNKCLAEISQRVGVSAIALLILENTGWCAPSAARSGPLRTGAATAAS